MVPRKTNPHTCKHPIAPGPHPGSRRIYGFRTISKSVIVLISVSTTRHTCTAPDDRHGEQAALSVAYITLSNSILVRHLSLTRIS